MKPVVASLLLVLAAGCARKAPSPDTPARAPEEPAHAPASTTPRRADQEPLGLVDFGTSCSPAGERAFNRALALLHHMMYEQADEAFTALVAREPTCSMARWGIAMSVYHPLWPDHPHAAALDRAEQELEAARRLAPRTERERDYLDAAEAYFVGWRATSEGARRARWADALRNVHERHPDDLDAAAFHALGLLATAPADDATLSSQRAAAAILARVHQASPTHPGALHYAVHAHDHPALAREGLPYARAYGALAPEVPHALHMPSHLYLRLGMWSEANELNRRSARAALRHPVLGKVSAHFTHAADYLVYGYLQQLDDRRARATLEELREVGALQPGAISAYNLAAAHARYALERRAWDEAAALRPEEILRGLNGDENPEAAAELHLARGLGAARTGDLESARRELRALDEISATLGARAPEGPRLAFWATRAAVQRDLLSGWIAHAEGDPERARAQLRRAVEQEAKTGKHAVMPGQVMPAREQLGELLLETGDATAALEAFEEALRETPGRPNALAGAARAATALGRRGTAATYDRRLLDVVAPDAAPRPILLEARARLAATASAP